MSKSRRIPVVVLSFVVSWVVVSTLLFFIESSSNTSIGTFGDALYWGGLMTFSDSNGVPVQTTWGRLLGATLGIFRNIFYVFVGILLSPQVKSLKKQGSEWAAQHFSGEKRKREGEGEDVKVEKPDNK